ncbi:MAG: zinc ribbon domain-containing protein [Eubacteriales bacterium]|nr:zinc ribbon domain-containing protein [Eubacteriales bacterium]
MPITYKCPNCGAAMEFDADSQTLACGQCDTKIPVEEYIDKYGENNQGSNMKIYHCQSCGAELVADEYTSATFCSFCGNPTLVEDRLNGDFKPSTVIPFKINREQAVDIYKKWLKKGPLTPRTLASSSTIEKISGVYAPFWLYDFAAQTRMEARAEKRRVTRRGDTEYIYTDHFRVYRDVAADFVKIPADASEKMPDDAMDKLEPYNYEELVPFQMPYLSGYLSERYNYTADQMADRVESRADQYITDIARGTIKGYSTVSVLSNNISMHRTNDEYALFPVWMLNCRYKGKNFQFMLNGQTGKIVASRPVSLGRAFAMGMGIFAVTLIITMIGGLILI